MAAPDVLVIGAGISGLTCARDLAAAGVTVRVLERSRGVGGRCATRRVDRQPVDHGLSFLHGSNSRFRTELDAVEGATAIPNWPVTVEGEGRPCHAPAIPSLGFRLAFLRIPRTKSLRFRRSGHGLRL